MPNKFQKLDNLPVKQDMEKLISNLEYKRISVTDLPEPLLSNGLVKTFNSVILAASGSSEGMLYSFVGIRPDHGDIDEHPFTLYYDYRDSAKNFGGIIHHGDWHERTTVMEQHQIDAINASGLTANFTYKSIPPNTSGSLKDLYDNGMISGYTTQFEVLMANRFDKKV